MQPPVGQFQPEKKGHTSPAASGQLNPLLQFEPEDRGVRRSEDDAVSGRPFSIAPAALRVEAVVRPQRKIEAPPVGRSNARRLPWSVVVEVACGSLFVALILVLMNAPSVMSLQIPLLPPSPAFPPVQAAAPVERSTDHIPFVPVILAEEKKPVAPPPVESRSPVIDAPVGPPSTASQPVASPRFFGSLSIDSIPMSARVFINGEPVGITPLMLTEIPVGSRAIRLEADDHTPWSSTVRVVAGQQISVSATLSPSR